MGKPAPELQGPVVIDATTLFTGTAAGKPRETISFWFAFSAAAVQAYTPPVDYHLVFVSSNTAMLVSRVNQTFAALSNTSPTRYTTDVFAYSTASIFWTGNVPVKVGETIYLSTGAGGLVHVSFAIDAPESA